MQNCISLGSNLCVGNEAITFRRYAAMRSALNRIRTSRGYSKLRLCDLFFMGTPDAAVPSLRRLLDDGHEGGGGVDPT